MSDSKIDDRTVADYLRANRLKYEDLLKEIVKLSEIVKDHPDAAGRVYRIYTRADKQTGNIFKDVWKIVEKMGGIREKKKSFPIQQLGDIIGATIVVVYPSDIDVVRKIIDDKIDGGLYKSWANSSGVEGKADFYGEEKKEGGYYAHHYQLEVGDNLKKALLRNARCELQIKTVLHDAWGAKTHDLTYKRAGALDARVKRQVEVLGDVLAGIDQQSELLRYIIEGRWVLDERKLKHARLALAKRTLTHDDEVKLATYLSLREEIIESAAGLVGKPTHDDAIQRLISRLDALAADGYDQPTCQLFCLLAQTVSTTDLAGLAIDRANAWKFGANSLLERTRVLEFLSMAHFSFGDKVEAVRQCREALELWEGTKDERAGLSDVECYERELKMRNSLAYYLADIADSEGTIRLTYHD